MALFPQALIFLLTSSLVLCVMEENPYMGADIRKKDMAKQGLIMRPGGFMNPMMFLLPLGISAMMLPLMTLMFASLVGGGGLFGKRRRRDAEDSEQEIQWTKGVKGILKILDVLQRSLEKYGGNED